MNTMPDWNAIASWGAGIVTVLGSVLVAAWLAVDKAIKVAKTAPPPVQRTDIITTDSAAMERLGNIVADNTSAVGVTNQLLAEVVTVGKDFTAMIRKERQDREIEDEVERRIAERDAAARPVRRRRAPRPKAEKL